MLQFLYMIHNFYQELHFLFNCKSYLLITPLTKPAVTLHRSEQKLCQVLLGSLLTHCASGGTASTALEIKSFPQEILESHSFPQLQAGSRLLLHHSENRMQKGCPFHNSQAQPSRSILRTIQMYKITSMESEVLPMSISNRKS